MENTTLREHAGDFNPSARGVVHHFDLAVVHQFAESGSEGDGVQVIPLNLLRALDKYRLVVLFGTDEPARQSVSSTGN
jgi:hypothetical protein